MNDYKDVSREGLLDMLEESEERLSASAHRILKLEEINKKAETVILDLIPAIQKALSCYTLDGATWGNIGFEGVSALIVTDEARRDRSLAELAKLTGYQFRESE